MSELDFLQGKLDEFRRKYYVNRLLRGAIYALGLSLLVIILVALLEYFGRFNSEVRLVLLLASCVALLILLIKYLILPLANLARIGRQVSSERLAKLLGKHFPGIDDKILNTLQLGDSGSRENELVLAAINQKVQELKPVPFLKAISFNENRRLLPILIVPVLVFVGLLLFEGGQEVLGSTQRVIKYKEAFIPPAPFSFNLLTKDLVVEAGEDLELELELAGDRIPGEVYVNLAGERLRMIKSEARQFTVKLENLEESKNLFFEAGMYRSKSYGIAVVPVPVAKEVIMETQAPAYTGMGAKTFPHKAEVSVPEGSTVNWRVIADNATEILFATDEDSLPFQDGAFGADFRLSEDYQLWVANSHTHKPATVPSTIKVIKDQRPIVRATFTLDSAYNEFLFYELSYNDDYGINKVEQLVERGGTVISRKNLLEGRGVSSGVINLDSIAGTEGGDFAIYFKVWDNDQVNGNKAAVSEKFEVVLKNEEERQEQLRDDINSYSSESEKILKKRENIQKSASELQKELLSKTQLDWQQKDKLKDLLKKVEQLQKEEKKQKRALQENLKRLSRKDSANALEEKVKELSEEEKQLNKLKEEIEKLMEQFDKEKLQEKLKELQQENKQAMRKEERMDKMLEDLMFQRDLLQKAKDLQDISKELDQLSKQEDAKEISQQDKLQEKLEETMKDLEELGEKSSELEEKLNSEEFQEAAENTESEMQKAKEELENGQQNEANSSQENASESAQEMSEQMQESIMQIQANAMQQNMESLRQILENLEIYSHEVEQVGNLIMELEKGDPRYREMLHRQNKLSTGSAVIEDSLKVLSERVPQVKEKVFEELEKMKMSVEEAKGHLQEQQTSRSAAKHQFSMMAANELALLLDESLQNMMQMMAMQMKGQQNCNKPGGGKPKPGSAGKKMQQLGKKVEKLKKGNSPGKGQEGINGKELVKILSEQEQLREQLKEMAKEAGEGKDGDLAKAVEEMNKIEEDLINNHLEDNFIERYRRVETRLLESEKSTLERKQKEQRESKSSDEVSMRYREALENYLREKEKQEEVLQLSPVYLTPFYKQRLNQEL